MPVREEIRRRAQNHGPAGTRARRKRKLSWLLLLLFACPGAALAQVGSGWTLKTFSERFEYESNDVLITISPPPSSFNNGYCEYDNTGGVETFQLLSSHSNRAETRPNDDYSSGSRQFQADVLVSSPSADECIHQIFNGSAAPYLLLREETNNHGSLKVALHTGGSASNLATNLYGVWFRLNSINDTTSSNAFLYVNGSLVWSGKTPGGTFYTKYGAYGTHTLLANIQFKNVKLFSGGNEVMQDFSLAASPAAQTLLPGGKTNYTVSVTFTNPVNNPVYFSVSNLPAGATAGFSPAFVIGSGSATLTVTNSSASAGAYTLTITAATSDSSDLTHTRTVTLVNPPAAPSISGGTFTNHDFQFMVIGTAQTNYVVQAATNLNAPNWISLKTNAAPFLFAETNANGFNQRFYRALLNP